MYTQLPGDSLFPGISLLPIPELWPEGFIPDSVAGQETADKLKNATIPDHRYLPYTKELSPGIFNHIPDG
jgi:hypothetical protein